MSEQSVTTRINDILLDTIETIAVLEECRVRGTLGDGEKLLFAELRGHKAETGKYVNTTVRCSDPHLLGRPMTDLRDHLALGCFTLHAAFARCSPVEELPLLPRLGAILHILRSETDQEGRPAR